jgi:hypothetical protein
MQQFFTRCSAEFELAEILPQLDIQRNGVLVQALLDDMDFL